MVFSKKSSRIKKFHIHLLQLATQPKGLWKRRASLLRRSVVAVRSRLCAAAHHWRTVLKCGGVGIPDAAAGALPLRDRTSFGKPSKRVPGGNDRLRSGSMTDTEFSAMPMGRGRVKSLQLFLADSAAGFHAHRPRIQKF